MVFLMKKDISHLVTNHYKYFKSAGINIGITICEDIWIPNGVSKDLAALGAQVILNLNASPFDKDKWETRELILKERVEEIGLPIVYVNQIGGQDELVFDGGSFAINPKKKFLLAPHNSRKRSSHLILKSQMNQVKKATNFLLSVMRRS